MKSPPLEQKMATLLDNRKLDSSHRTLTTVSPSSIDFSSNDFLSLSTSPFFRSAYLKELNEFPENEFRIGSGGSRLLDGNTRYAEELEETIARFHGAEAALLWGSGFDANEGFFGCVAGREDFIIFDEKIHASVRAGMKLSRSTAHIPFPHNSVSSLRTLLHQLVSSDPGVKAGTKNVFIAVESLYSMDGDLCPLLKIVELVKIILEKGNGCIVVDEAHSTGVFGRQGRGMVNELGLESKVFARLVTFGKALGCNGAAILSSKLTREYLINYAKPLIYTTAMGFPSLAAIKVVYSLLVSGQTDPLRQSLESLISFTYSKLQTLRPLIPAPQSPSRARLLALPPTAPKSPIFSLQTTSPKILAKYCQERGLIVRAIMPPTVPVGTQRVRVCLHAGNNEGDVERLVGVLGEWLVLQRKVIDELNGKGVDDEILEVRRGETEEREEMSRGKEREGSVKAIL